MYIVDLPSWENIFQSHPVIHTKNFHTWRRISQRFSIVFLLIHNSISNGSDYQCLVIQAILTGMKFP